MSSNNFYYFLGIQQTIQQNQMSNNQTKNKIDSTMLQQGYNGYYSSLINSGTNSTHIDDNAYFNFRNITNRSASTTIGFPACSKPQSYQTKFKS
jgi:hypothetical protein